MLSKKQLLINCCSNLKTTSYMAPNNASITTNQHTLQSFDFFQKGHLTPNTKIVKFKFGAKTIQLYNIFLLFFNQNSYKPNP